MEAEEVEVNHRRPVSLYRRPLVAGAVLAAAVLATVRVCLHQRNGKSAGAGVWSGLSVPS